MIDFAFNLAGVSTAGILATAVVAEVCFVAPPVLLGSLINCITHPEYEMAA